MDNSGVYGDIAIEKGWSLATQVDVLLTYIGNQQSDAAFVDFLQRQPDEAEPTNPVFKSVFRVTVLTTNQHVASGELEEALREIDHGDSIGQIERTTLNAIVPADEIRAELLAIGNDGTFFDGEGG